MVHCFFFMITGFTLWPRRLPFSFKFNPYSQAKLSQLCHANFVDDMKKLFVAI